jgi:hypothetical protein
MGRRSLLCAKTAGTVDTISFFAAILSLFLEKRWLTERIYSIINKLKIDCLA